MAWRSELSQGVCVQYNAGMLENSAQVGVLAGLCFGVVVENLEQNGQIALPLLEKCRMTVVLHMVKQHGESLCIGPEVT